jgi:predicted RNase H-like HicB family nuclease
MALHEYRYTVLFEPAEEGVYVVTCPALPGLVTEGDTLDQARDMAADAIRGYLESLAKDGRPRRRIRSAAPFGQYYIVPDRLRSKACTPSPLLAGQLSQILP